MPKFIDLTGKRFGSLTVIRKHPERKGTAIAWECQCDCGGSTLSIGNNLTRGLSKTCGKCEKNTYVFNDDGTSHIFWKNKLVSIIDAEDYDLIKDSHWRLSGNGYTQRNRPSAEHNFLHRLLMDAPKGVEVDHRNGIKIDNRRENLRLCTSANNSRNIGMRSNNTSGYKGVTWIKDLKKWRASICLNYQSHILGYFDDPAEAGEAYDIAAANLHGAFANLNQDMTGGK